MFNDIIPMHRIFDASIDDINRLKYTKLSHEHIKNFHNYIVIYYDNEDNEHLHFNFQKLITDYIDLNTISLIMQNKSIRELSFHEKSSIYYHIERSLSFLEKVDFNEYFANQDKSYNRQLLNSFFNSLSMDLQYIYLENILLHVDKYSQLCSLYTNKEFIKDNAKKISINYRLVKYIITNFDDISIFKVGEIRKNPDTELIKINLHDTLENINKMIKKAKQKLTIKLKGNESQRENQVSLILKVWYALNTPKIYKSNDLIKKTIELGHNYKLEDEKVTYHNMNEEYIDYIKLEKNSRLFNETLKLFNKKDRSRKTPF